VARSRAERFDEAVLDALERLERRWATELGGVQVLVEDVPPPPAGTAAASPGPGDSGSDRAAAPAPSSDTAADDERGAFEVPLGRVDPAGRRRPARLVVYRRPVEARAVDDGELAELTRRVLTGLVADLLGLTVDDVDPDAPTDP
jgi:predicted Zn-dependent protease with MMP-like domain